MAKGRTRAARFPMFLQQGLSQRSERRGGFEGNRRAAEGVAEAKMLGMKLEPRGGGALTVEWVAENRVAEREAVDPELVSTAGQRNETQARRAGLAREDVPVRDGLPATCVTDHLLRPIRPVRGEPQVDAAVILSHLAGDARDVALANLAPFELPPEMAMRKGGAGEDHQAGCVPVQPVDEPCVGISAANPRLDAVLRTRGLGRDGMQAGGLVDDDEGCIEIEEAQRAEPGRLIHVKAHGRIACHGRMTTVGSRAMYKHILVPIDLGHDEVGDHILKVAQFLAGPSGKVSVLSVLEPVPGYVANYIPRDVADKSREDARQRLEAKASASGIQAEIVLRTGNAANEILEEAREAGCDAIVIGSHRPDYRDYFIGSTAARVVRHASCTVVVERTGSLTPKH
jgi:universal stress protein F